MTYADYDTKEYPKYIEFPVLFRVTDGAKLSDIVSMRYIGMSILVSDRLVTLLQQNNITGWATYPIRLMGKRGDEISGYRGFTVTGRAGAIAELVPEKEIVYECRNRFRQWERSSWDGSDFAHIKGRYKTICSERVRNIIKDSLIKGFYFDPLEEDVTII